VASFSRALAEGLSAQQTDAEFNARLDDSIAKIYDASTVKVTGVPAAALAT
jgi:fructose-bisphosphate aldolase class I